MADRYDILTFREGSDGKSYATKIGTAFPRKNGEDGFSIVFDALPLDGRAMMMPPKPRDDRGGFGGGQSQGGGAPRGDQGGQRGGGGQRKGPSDFAGKDPDPADDIPF
jgi:hypothetical protein